MQPTHTGPLPAGETFASESKLDTLAVHTMWRAAYRNFGSFESVVIEPQRTEGQADTQYRQSDGMNSRD